LKKNMQTQMSHQNSSVKIGGEINIGERKNYKSTRKYEKYTFNYRINLLCIQYQID
jgi:hypothetical protein